MKTACLIKKQNAMKLIAVFIAFFSVFAFSGDNYRAAALGIFKTDENAAAQKEIKKALDKFEPSVTLKSEIDKDDIADLFYELLLENKQYYYVSSEITYTYSTKTDLIHTINFNYCMDRDTARSTRTAFNNAFKSYITKVDKKWTDLQKCIFIHDALIMNCKYDTTVQKMSYTAYGALVSGKAVCQGYSLAYAQLLSELGIECTVAYSLKDNHMWNCVKIGDSWYNVDVTYDDPLPDAENQVYHSLFLKSTREINKDGRHNLTADEAPVVTNSSAFDYAFWNDLKSPMSIDGDLIFYVTTNGAISSFNVKNSSRNVIYQINDIWKIYGTDSYYQGIFSSCAFMKKNLYFNTSDSVYSFDTSKQTVSKEKTVSIADGCLYGVKAEEGAVYALKKNSPSSYSDCKWEKIL